ncbi:MAG: hypothetical protein IJL23_01070 [Alphaproteobacteria bacterium]|nr:hypothetical protein [Alphaproteobacteria bacterium]MBQ6110497.1 hypothetical protein [Alphaproteobacteria bacterium]
MKYVKSGTFTTKQFSIEETITETRDVIGIAQDIIKNIPDVSEEIKKSLDLALKNLDETTDYLDHIQRKTDIALRFVPEDVQEKEFL